VDSIAAGVTNAAAATPKGWLPWILTLSGFVWQRVPVRIRLDKQQGNLWPAGTTATVVITGKEDRDTTQVNFFQKLAMRLREFG
jgi:p-hydroxybenzoic acid efflux pump subunit AaeA